VGAPGFSRGVKVLHNLGFSLGLIEHVIIEAGINGDFSASPPRTK